MKKRLVLVAALVASPPVFADTLAFSVTKVTGCIDVTATLTLTEAAPAGGATFTTSVAPPGLLLAPSSVTVAEGATTVTFTVATAQVATGTLATLTLTGSSTVSRTLTLAPNSPRSITGPSRLGPSSTSSGTVTLVCPAPAAGLTVAMTSNNAAVLQVPATIVFASGELTSTYAITTADVSTQATVTVNATSGGVSRPTSVIVKPPTPRAFSFSSTVPVGGDAVEGVVSLDLPAAVSGAAGTFTSSNAAVAGPASGSFTVAAGQSQGRFPITTTAVDNDVAVIFTATVNGASRSATLTVRRNRVETIALSHTTVSACRPIDGIIRLRANAPAGGTVVALVLDRTDIASLSSPTVTITEGTREAAFTVDFLGPVNPSATAVLSASIQAQTNPTVKTVPLNVLRTSSIGCP